MAPFPDGLNEQVGHEFGASQQYIAIAVHYDALTLPRLAAHFFRQAVEERNHAMMIVQYLLDADEPVVVPGVAAPQTEFADVVEPVRLALEQEKRVTAQISALTQLARDRRRSRRRAVPALVPAGAARGGLVDGRPAHRRRALADNVMLIEDYLARETVGDAWR